MIFWNIPWKKGILGHLPQWKKLLVDPLLKLSDTGVTYSLFPSYSVPGAHQPHIPTEHACSASRVRYTRAMKPNMLGENVSFARVTIAGMLTLRMT